MASTGSRRLITLFGLLVSAAFVLVAVRHLDARAVLEVWKTANPLPWLPLAVAAYVTGHFFRGFRLRFLVRRDARLSLPTASNVVIVGYASNNVLPARLGEFVRAGMLAERTGIPLAQALTVTFIERLLDGVAILFLLVVSTIGSDAAGWIRQLARVGALVFGVALAGLIVAILFPRLLLSIAARLLQVLGPKWRDRILGTLTSIVGATTCLRRPQDAAIIASLSVVVWIFEALMFVCVLPAVNLPVRFGSGVIGMSVTNLGILVPSTPGFVGPFHFFCSQAIQSQGASETIAMAYAVLVHLAFYVPATLWGAGAMLWYGVQVGATAALARAARKAPRKTDVAGVTAHFIARVQREPRPDGPSDFDVALTEALLPERTEPAPERIREVASFLSAQIDALPPRLRALYHAGMSAFRLFVRVRYFSSFCALPEPKRRAAVLSWAFGPIELTRQLFRPARSTVLLGWYEGAEIGAGERPVSLRVPRATKAAHG